MTPERLSAVQIALLAAYAAAMAAGQLLFKAAAQRYTADASLADRALSLLLNGYFIAATVLYVALTGLWVWILTFTPLSRAYPFVALAFAVTPLLGGWLFNEPITPRLCLGLVLILCGLLAVAG